jgi:glutaredoxin
MKIKPTTKVVLHSKPGCHLCEQMKAQIELAGCSELYQLEVVNIEDDPVLLSKYQYEIPVLVINGVEVFRYRVRAEEFKNYLVALAD